ncbi:MAG: glycosyltransferase [Pseudoalteromonas rhizosphaerae]|uniref:glycosyltransferase n=1 Tax=Pseudoalteromonas rhizosphaerae TaxID=2518973 RepID=UPI003C7329EF
MGLLLPKFSALGSLYHGESPEYLQMALSSLNEQSLKADEVILVFDGPVGDELQIIVQRWQKKLNIKVVALQTNQGLGDALNHGLAACTYSYIARFDTDDINAPERFEKQLKIAVEKNADLVSATVEEFDQVPGDLQRFRCASQSKHLKKQLAKRNVINHMAVLFKKDAVLLAGGYLHLHFMEDYYLWLRMKSNNAQFILMPESLVDARIGNGMEKRRSGWNYVKSEWQLAKVKNQLGYTSKLSGAMLFCLRASTRLLPVSILKSIYKVFLRN